MSASPPRSWGLSVVAGSAPAGFAVVGCVLLALAASNLADPVRGLGPWFFGIVLVALLSAFATTGATLLSAAGFRVPTALPVALACGPWLVGTLSMFAGARESKEALVHAAPNTAQALIATAVGYILPARALGAWVSGALLAGVAVGLAVGALARRAPNRRGIAAIGGTLMGLALLGLAVGSSVPLAFSGDYENLPLVLPGIAALVALPLAVWGAGRDEPHGRAASMAVGATVAAALAIAATAAAVSSMSLSVTADGLSHAPPDARLGILGKGITAAAAAEPVVHWALLLGLVCTVVVAVWSLLRGRTGLRGALSVVSLLAVGCLMFTADYAAMHSVEAMAIKPEQLYLHLEDFQPIPIEDGEPLIPVIAVSEAGAVTRSGASSLEDAVADAASLDYFPEQTPKTLEEEPPLGVFGGHVLTTHGTSHGPRLAVALSQGTSAGRLNELFRRSSKAGYRGLWLVGRPTELDSVPPEFRDFGPAQTLLQSTAAVPIDTPGPVADVRVAPDEVLWYGELTNARKLKLQATDGEGHKSLVLDDKAARKRQPSNPYGVPGDGPGPERVYVTLGAQVDAGILVTAARALDAQGVRLVVYPKLPRALLEHAVAPRETGEKLDGLGLGLLGKGSGLYPKPHSSAQAKPGNAEVRGSLDKARIQRVIKRRLRSIKYCYEKELAASPTLAGRIVIRITISATGSVSATKVEKNTLGSAALGQCVERVVRRMRFPEPKGGGIVIVHYPFVFSPGN